MLDLWVTEHFMLDGPVSGDDVDAPAPLGDMVQGRAVFGDVQRVQGAVEHVNGRHQNDAVGNRRHRAEGDERIQRCLAVVTALGQPLGAAESQVETQGFGLLDDFGVVVEGPGVGRRVAGQADVLHVEEHPQQQGLLQGLAQGAVGEVQRCRKRRAFNRFIDVGLSHFDILFRRMKGWDTPAANAPACHRDYQK
jgi:hypothetical protein